MVEPKTASALLRKSARRGREDGLRPSRCRYVVASEDGRSVRCDEPILWGESLAGRMVALDPEPDLGGDWVAIGDGLLLALSPVRHMQMMGEPHREGERYLDHYCPARARDWQEACEKRRRAALLDDRRAEVRRKRREPPDPYADEPLPW